MKTEAQMQSLLEWMGWRFQEGTKPTYGGTNIPRGWINPSNRRLCVNHPPLTLDLMHESRSKLNPTQRKTYGRVLRGLIMDEVTQQDTATDFDIANATAVQHLKTMLIVINKWTG